MLALKQASLAEDKAWHLVQLAIAESPAVSMAIFLMCNDETTCLLNKMLWHILLNGVQEQGFGNHEGADAVIFGNK